MLARLATNHRPASRGARHYCADAGTLWSRNADATCDGAATSAMSRSWRRVSRFEGRAGGYCTRKELEQYVTIFRSPVRLTYIVFVPVVLKPAVAEMLNVPLELTVPL